MRFVLTNRSQRNSTANRIVPFSGRRMRYSRRQFDKRTKATIKATSATAASERRKVS